MDRRSWPWKKKSSDKAAAERAAAAADAAAASLVSAGSQVEVCLLVEVLLQEKSLKLYFLLSLPTFLSDSL